MCSSSAREAGSGVRWRRQRKVVTGMRLVQPVASLRHRTLTLAKPQTTALCTLPPT